MDRETLLQKFDKLNIWTRAGERAPHKPLLVMYAIGELLRGKDRLQPYSEIDKKLAALLGEFGPPRSSRGTQYPFWRLQNDGVWEVSDAHKIRLSNSGDAFKRDLVFYDVAGGFTEEVASCLQANPELVIEIVENLLNGHFTESYREDILQAVGIDSDSSKQATIQIDSGPPDKSKPQSPSRFRTNVLKAYEYQCAVCGFNVRLGQRSIALEAAHIKWRMAGGPNEEENGLALCTLHHKLFDRGAFMISEDLEILVSDDAYGTGGFREWLMRFHGEKLKLPQRQTYFPSESYTRWHVNEVFKGDYREL